MRFLFLLLVVFQPAAATSCTEDSCTQGNTAGAALLQHKGGTNLSKGADIEDEDGEDVNMKEAGDESEEALGPDNIDVANCPWSCVSNEANWVDKCLWNQCKPCKQCELWGKTFCKKDHCYKKDKYGEYRQPWSKKCLKQQLCGGCDECVELRAGEATTTTTTSLDPCWWKCVTMDFSWGQKCEWKECSKCAQCEAWAKQKKCSDSCHRGRKGWKEKCRRSLCGACDECDRIYKKHGKDAPALAETDGQDR